MNNTDFELERRIDVEDERRTTPRVSNDDAVVIEDSDEVADGGRGGGVHAMGSFRSQETRVFNAGVADIDSSPKAAHSESDEIISFDLISTQEIRVPKHLENRASGSKNANVTESRMSGDMVFMASDIKNRDVVSKDLDKGFGDRDSGFEHGERGELIPKAINGRVDARNGNVEHSFSRAAKGHVEMGKPSVYQYDSMLSMFDEFAANEMDEAVLAGSSKHVGYGYQIGDMIWGKVKSHPWWPGHIYNEALASPSVRRTKREGFVLVAFFGDNSYGWFDPAELIPFDLNFAEKSRQTNSRTFVKAVEEAVDEASRRCGLGLACRCRNPYNFRPTNIGGYFSVDVCDYEPGAVYSARQIKKARDNFQSREILAFVKQLALAHSSEDNYGSIHFIKNRATALAYRKAVFEEFDETYAQAFGYQPVRPSREPGGIVSLPSKEPSRAPLSGPLVIAEALGKGKGSGKPIKAKDRAKKDRYLFKRRDEPNELKSPLINKGLASSSTQPVYMENSSSFAAGDYVLQKRAPVVSIKSEIPAKHEQMEIFSTDNASASSQDVTGKESVFMGGKPAVAKFNIAGSQVNVNKVESSVGFPVDQDLGYSSHAVDSRTSIDQGQSSLEVEERSESDVAMDFTSMGGIGLSGRGGLYSAAVDDRSHTSVSGVNDGFQQLSSQQVTIEQCQGGKHDLNGQSGASVLGAFDTRLHDEGSRMHGDIGAKKAKVRKHPDGELGNEKLVIVEQKNKKKKKKRKKDSGMEMGPDQMQMHAIVGKGGEPVGKVPGKTAQVALAPRDNIQANYKKNDDGTSSSLLHDSIGPLQMAGIGNIEVELPKLLVDLQALARYPFHGAEREGPAIVRQIFLRFRSLVYQKSLASLPPTENESNEDHASKAMTVTADSDNPPSEDARDMKPLKVPRPSVRHDDATKGGQKRSPSDRQQEIAERKKKKMNDPKLLAAEKRAAQKNLLVLQGDGKAAAIQMQPKAVRPEFAKKMERSAKAPDPMMLVMKFQPGGTLPSLPELKARFARFGPMDHSASRIFWKSSTCRVVFRYKLDAQAAYKFATGTNNLFGNSNVRCHLREVGDPATKSESGKVQREDASVGNPTQRVEAVEPRSAGGLAHRALQQQQPAVQLKSCLKKLTADEPGSVSGVTGGGRVIPRVTFMLSGEESRRGGQLMFGNKNNFNNNGSFADGGASSSTTSTTTTTHAMDFNTRNFQKAIPAYAPVLPHPSAQYAQVSNKLHYTEVAPFRHIHNSNGPNTPPSALPSANIDIAQQMLSLLTKCNDVVSNVSGLLGYVPYHPL